MLFHLRGQHDILHHPESQEQYHNQHLKYNFQAFQLLFALQMVIDLILKAINPNGATLLLTDPSMFYRARKQQKLLFFAYEQPSGKQTYYL